MKKKKNMSQTVLSYTRIREYAERWTWMDLKSRRRYEGLNPPPDAVEKKRVPFNVLFLTDSGKAISGKCITLRVNTELHTREVMFVESGEIRQISDLFIIEIDGVRFNVH